MSKMGAAKTWSQLKGNMKKGRAGHPGSSEMICWMTHALLCKSRDTSSTDLWLKNHQLSDTTWLPHLFASLLHYILSAKTTFYVLPFKTEAQTFAVVVGTVIGDTQS